MNELRETKHGDEESAGNERGYSTPSASAQQIQHSHDGGENDKVCRDQDHDARTKKGEERGVEILRERPVKKIDIAIEDGPFRKPPRSVKLISEINQRVAPLA